MGQSPSRTADFAGVLPAQQNRKFRRDGVAASCSSSASPIVVVSALNKLPEHSIASINPSNVHPSTSSEIIQSSRRTDGGSADSIGLYAEPESVRKSRALDDHADVCSEILDGFLYVSNIRVAQDSGVLDAHGITHVVDCCSELTTSAENKPANSDTDRVYLRLALRDDTREDLTPFLLYRIMPFIAKCRQQHVESGKAPLRVLIHCHQGVSRSCAVAIAFVMLDCAMPFHEAAAYVKQRRAISSPNAAFLCQLIQWGRDLEEILGQTNSGRLFSGLLRLTPHAQHDPHTLVFKRSDSGGIDWKANEASNLWTGGTYVYQEVGGSTAIWIGSSCKIDKAAQVAKELLKNAMLVKSFASARTIESTASVVEIHGVRKCESDNQLFEYAEELSWYIGCMNNDRLSFDRCEPTRSGVDGPQDGAIEAQTLCAAQEGNDSPQLFLLESLNVDGSGEWEQLKQYDAEDLTPQDIFLLLHRISSAEGAEASPSSTCEGFLWIGEQCSHDTDRALHAAQHQIEATLVVSQGIDTGNITTERQNRESQRFWCIFELGY